jgi:hypothetical protein
VILVALATFALALPATALGVAAFRTPKKAAYCGLTEGEGPSHLLCWTPNDGFTVDMGGRSQVRKRYISAKPWLLRPGARSGPALRPELAHGAVPVCQRSLGLTCTNGGRHGWWLGRFRGYRIF